MEARPLFHVALAAMLASLLLAGSAAEAGAAKKPKEPIRYTGSLVISGGSQGTSTCGDNYTSNWALQATYYATELDETATLDAKTRTANGGLTTTRLCPPLSPEPTETCPVIVESPPPGEHAGDEDGHFTKGLVGLIRGLIVDFANLPLMTGPGCHGNGGPYVTGMENPVESQVRVPQGVIPSKQIGKKKVITVPISGFGNAARPGIRVSAQMSGTLTLKRVPSKKK